MSNLLEIEGLLKKYYKKEVISDLNLNVEEGCVLGILGPNGHGKTTLLNVIAGLLKPENGSVKIEGKEVGEKTKEIVSYMQEKNIIPKWMKVKDIIEFYRDFYKDFDNDEMERLLKFMNLNKEMKTNNLSKGMCEKLALSLTLSRRSKLYILDEPISGVDPVTREKIIDCILDRIDGNISMIITTHYVNEVEKILDKVVFLRDGVIVEQGNVDDLRGKYNDSLDGIYRRIFTE